MTVFWWACIILLTVAILDPHEGRGKAFAIIGVLFGFISLMANVLRIGA